MRGIPSKAELSYLLPLSICHSHLIPTTDNILNSLSQGSVIWDDFSVRPSITYF